MSPLSTADAAQADRFGIRARRSALGLSREKFAHAAEVSAGTVRLAEFGYLGSDSLPRIKRALDALETEHGATD